MSLLPLSHTLKCLCHH